MAVQCRKGLKADFNANNLLAGELAYCTDTHEFLIGNGDGTASNYGTNLQNQIDNLQVGTRNLYDGTQDFSGSRWLEIERWAEDGTYRGGKVYKKKDTWSGLRQLISVKAGDYITISAYVKADGGNIMANFFGGTTSVARGILVKSNIVTAAEFTRVSATFLVTASGDDLQPRFELDGNSSPYTMWICWISVVRGQHPSDESLSIADISAINTKIDTYVEHGTNTNGEYYKYSDGRLECFKTHTNTNLNISDKWGTPTDYVYENTVVVSTGAWAYPFLTGTNPTVIITPQYGTGYVAFNIEYINPADPVNGATFKPWRPDLVTARDIIYSVAAFGRWK